MITGLLTASLLTGTIQTYADTSTTVIEIHNDQKNVVSGINPNVQNCVEINVDALNTAGDEGFDCHNQREENSNQSATD
jgi:hypothetical protein